MAKKANKDDEAAEGGADEAPKSGKKKKLVMMGGAVALVPVLGGGGWFFFMKKKPADEVTAEQAAAAAKKLIPFVEMKDMMIGITAGPQHDRQPIVKIKVALEIAPVPRTPEREVQARRRPSQSRAQIRGAGIGDKQKKAAARESGGGRCDLQEDGVLSKEVGRGQALGLDPAAVRQHGVGPGGRAVVKLQCWQRLRPQIGRQSAQGGQDCPFSGARQAQQADAYRRCQFPGQRGATGLRLGGEPGVGAECFQTGKGIVMHGALQGHGPALRLTGIRPPSPAIPRRGKCAASCPARRAGRRATALSGQGIMRITTSETLSWCSACFALTAASRARATAALPACGQIAV